MKAVFPVVRRAADLPRGARAALVAVTDVLACVAAAIIAFWLRLGEWHWFDPPVLTFLAIAVPVWLTIALSTDTYRSLVRFSGRETIWQLARRCTLMSLTLGAILVPLQLPGVPRTLSVLHPLVFLLMLAGSRVGLSSLLLQALYTSPLRQKRKRVLIYGAGSAGQQLAASVLQDRQIRVIGFVDENRVLSNRSLEGKPIWHTDDLERVLQAVDAELATVIEQVWRDSRRTYGWPRVWGQLTRRRGMAVSRRRVARIMREHGFVGAHTRRKWRRGRPDVAPATDHLQRVFTAERPNLRWVADITEFPTGEGKLHLAGIRDLCHRGIVGWSMDEHQDAQLVVDALTMALGRTAPDPDGLIHHSDKGSQYTALDFVMAAGHAGLQLSFGSTGDCFDNAAMETFWATLKREIAHIRGSSGIWFETRDAARAYLFEFIEVFYNRQRHQAGLGHLTPAEYAARFRERP